MELEFWKQTEFGNKIWRWICQYSVQFNSVPLTKKWFLFKHWFVLAIFGVLQNSYFLMTSLDHPSNKPKALCAISLPVYFHIQNSYFPSAGISFSLIIFFLLIMILWRRSFIFIQELQWVYMQVNNVKFPITTDSMITAHAHCYVPHGLCCFDGNPHAYVITQVYAIRKCI